MDEGKRPVGTPLGNASKKRLLAFLAVLPLLAAAPRADAADLTTLVVFWGTHERLMVTMPANSTAACLEQVKLAKRLNRQTLEHAACVDRDGLVHAGCERGSGQTKCRLFEPPVRVDELPPG